MRIQGKTAKVLVREQVSEEAAKVEEDSAVAIARLVVDNRDNLFRAHVKELLSIAIWKFTVARGKYATRYATPAALEADALPRHEHVIPRKEMIDAMLLHPERVEHIMRLATARNVTHEQHKLLKGPHVGWHRYSEAGLVVVDRYTREAVDLEAMAESLRDAWNQVTAI